MLLMEKKSFLNPLFELSCANVFINLTVRFEGWRCMYIYNKKSIYSFLLSPYVEISIISFSKFVITPFIIIGNAPAKYLYPVIGGGKNYIKKLHIY